MVTTCGSKKKKMAEARLKAGRKRLADVILELQGSLSFDATVLQERLQEVCQSVCVCVNDTWCCVAVCS